MYHLGCALIFQTEGEIEDGLTVVGVRIALLPYLHSSAQIGLCLTEASTTQIPQACLGQAAHIVRITAQGLFVIVEGTPCGMTVLLQMESRQVELVVGLRLLRREGSLSGIGNGSDVIGLCLP